MTPTETRAPRRDGIVGACKLLAGAAALAAVVALSITHPGAALLTVGLPAAGFGVLWMLFALVESERPTYVRVGAVAWRVLGHAALLGLIYFMALWLDPPFARFMAELPAQVWHNTTW